MSYLFTLSEQAQIQSAINASTGLTFNSAQGKYTANPAVGSNAVPLYQTLSNIMGNPAGSASGTVLQDMKNAKLWLDVAIGANGGTGIHSAFIRTYTTRQGELRLGRIFTASEMQEASNAVASNFANALIKGDPLGGLAKWTLPRIDQIASIDARAVGDTLFGPLPHSPFPLETQRSTSTPPGQAR